MTVEQALQPLLLLAQDADHKLLAALLCIGYEALNDNLHANNLPVEESAIRSCV